MALIRLDKFLTDMGVDTRSGVKKLIKQGAVTVAGKAVKDNGLKIATDSEVKVKGKKISYSEFTYIMLNKPQGVVSAVKDDKEKTVTDLLEEPYSNMELFPVGRLDKDTVGLLILTNDGEFAHKSLSPKKHVDKTYYVEAEGSFNENIAEAFKEGITLEDGYKCKSASLEIKGISEDLIKCNLTITEGKFHQIKRMFAALGGRVVYLKRVAFGAMTLDPDLKEGEYRPLNENELKLIKREV